MAIRAINTYTQTVTPAVAAAWLGFRYDKQRPLSDAKVKQLSEAMRRGRFTTNTIKFCVSGENRNLVNGQHTLNAVLKADVTITLPVQDFVVETDHDVAVLYYNEDTNRKRTFSDSVRAVDLESSVDLTSNQITQLSSALKWAKANFGLDRRSIKLITQDDLLELIPLWAPEYKAVLSAISPCTREDRNLIVRQPVLSIALLTMRHAPEKSRQFWGQVARDDGLERNDVRKALRRWLQENSISRGGAGASTRVPQTYASRACAFSWNIFMTGSDRINIRVTEQLMSKPISLTGTPYSGNQSVNYLSLSPSPLSGGQA